MVWLIAEKHHFTHKYLNAKIYIYIYIYIYMFLLRKNITKYTWKSDKISKRTCYVLLYNMSFVILLNTAVGLSKKSILLAYIYRFHCTENYWSADKPRKVKMCICSVPIVTVFVTVRENYIAFTVCSKLHQ